MDLWRALESQNSAVVSLVMMKVVTLLRGRRKLRPSPGSYRRAQCRQNANTNLAKKSL